MPGNRLETGKGRVVGAVGAAVGGEAGPAFVLFGRRFLKYRLGNTHRKAMALSHYTSPDHCQPAAQ